MNVNLPFFNNLSADDNILLKQILDWIYLAENKYAKKFSFFLNENQSVLCQRIFESQKFESYSFYGGYENAKRKLLCVHSPYEKVAENDFPLEPLLFKYRKADNLSHRDFLGTLMALNIARNTIGDIIITDSSTQVFVYDKIAPVIIDNISKIGSVGVCISKGKMDNINVSDKFQRISGTVSSLRLDCVLSLILRLSREKIKMLIATKDINVNYMSINKPDYQLKESDVFSVRGYGKFIFESVDRITKKDRFHITIKKYI